jgi:hypothetical protein
MVYASATGTAKPKELTLCLEAGSYSLMEVNRGPGYENGTLLIETPWGRQ